MYETPAGSLSCSVGAAEAPAEAEESEGDPVMHQPAKDPEIGLLEASRSRPAALRTLLVVLLVAGPMSAPLAHAVPVTGLVRRPDGTPAVGVNLDFIDADGVSLPLTGDVTDAAGAYTVDVPPGLYAVNHKVPAASGLAHEKIRGVEVVAPATNLPDVVLPWGYHVTGLVLDSAGFPVFDANTLWRDSATGEQWLTLSDHSDATGAYSVLIAAGTWDATYDPPPGAPMLPVTVTGIVVAGDTAQPDVILPDGLQVSGRVVDGAGSPVVDANTLFADPAGDTVRTVDDHTDPTGLFRTFVAPDTYSLQVWPPAGSGLLAAELPGQVITVDTVLPDIVLDAGSTVTGRVVDALGAPVFDVDTDWNLPTYTVLTPGDNTDSTGAYEVVVPDGTYLVDLDPAVGSRHAAASVPGQVVAGDTVLPDFVLDTAWFVTGRVVDSTGAPVVDANTLTRDAATLLTVRTIRDHSDTDGEFVLALPDGTYDIGFLPPAGSTLAAVRLHDVVVSGADLRLPDVVLPDGFLLSGVVVDTSGAPVAAVDLDVNDPITGVRLLTPGDKTDAAGAYATRVPAGTWQLQYEPPAPYLPQTFEDVVIGADTARPDVVLRRQFVLSGLVEDSGGRPVPGAEVRFEDPVTGFDLAPPVITNGSCAFSVPLIEGDVRLVTTPALDSGLAGDTRDLVLSSDMDLGAVVLQPLLETLTPPTGSLAGGDLLTLTGRELVAGMTVELGGSAAAVHVLSPTSAELTTALHPTGVVDLVATWPDGRTAVLPGAFEYVSLAEPADLRVRKDAGDVVLSWTQAPGTTRLLFSDPRPDGLDDASLQGSTTALEWRDAGAVAAPGLRCYLVE